MNEMAIFNAASDTNAIPYCSFQPDTAEGATALFNAMSQAENAIKEFINMDIEVADVFVQGAVQVDEETGEARETAKVVVFDSEGHTYATTSMPFYKTLCNLCTMIGPPDKWVSPIVIKPVQIKVKKGQMLSFEVISWGNNKVGQQNS